MIKDEKTRVQLKKSLGYYEKGTPKIKFEYRGETILKQVRNILFYEKYLLVETNVYSQKQRDSIIKSIHNLRKSMEIDTCYTADGTLYYKLVSQTIDRIKEKPNTPKRTREYHTLGVSREALNGLYQGEIFDFTLKTVNDTGFVLKVFCGIPTNKDTKNTMIIPDHVGKGYCNG